MDQVGKSDINLLKESIFNIFQVSLQNDNDDFSVQIKDFSKMYKRLCWEMTVLQAVIGKNSL